MQYLCRGKIMVQWTSVFTLTHIKLHALAKYVYNIILIYESSRNRSPFNEGFVKRLVKWGSSKI